MNAIFGWKGMKQAMPSTQAADRKRFALAADSKLERTPDEHPIPSPTDKVWAPKEKER